MSHGKEEILQHLYKTLSEMFDLEEAQLNPQAKLEEDLDLDSIDSIELLIELNEFVGRDVDANEFDDVVTIDDMVSIIMKIEQEIEDS
jgi:acyl carrier protein